MDGEKRPVFRLRWMLPIYLVLGALWTVAVAIDIAIGGLTSPVYWLNIVLVALVLIGGIVIEWRHRRQVASTHAGVTEPDDTDSSSLGR